MLAFVNQDELLNELYEEIYDDETPFLDHYDEVEDDLPFADDADTFNDNIDPPPT